MSAPVTNTKPSFDVLISGDKPVLVDFYADWCAPCQMMPPILSEVNKVLGDKLTIIKIDMEKNPQVAIKYQVRGIPNLILIKNGQVIWQQAGVIPAERLIPILETYL